MTQESSKFDKKEQTNLHLGLKIYGKKPVSYTHLTLPTIYSV